MRTLLVAVLLFSTSFVGAKNWAQVNPFPGTAFSDGANFLVGDTIYIEAD